MILTKTNLKQDTRIRCLLWTILLSAAWGLTQLALSGCASAQAPQPLHSKEAPHWTYEGDTGPEYWYALAPEYAIARDGKAQSPIDIITGDLIVDSEVAKPVIAYSATVFEIENNGHTIELLPAASGNYVVIDGEPYELQQFHFHAPSEHLFDGSFFDMELHLVHKNAQGNLAVLGIMLSQGEHNEILGEIFENLPQEITGEGTVKPEVEINLADLFTGNEAVYRYDGSLTTPPCTEGVKWNIVAEPVEMSIQQIDAFGALYKGNNRPVQNRYERPVYAVEGNVGGE
jgi:carbonic anhydrase